MITDAISTLKERNGSSQQAIAKFIEEKHKKSLPSNFRKVLSVQLKKFVKSERLFKVKNSFKISSTEKLAIEIKETQQNKAVKARKKTTKAAQQKVTEKGMRTKRLSQVKTPDALKKDGKKKSVASAAAKVKRLSQVKTPEGMKKKKASVTPLKKKNGSRSTKKAGKQV